MKAILSIVLLLLMAAACFCEGFSWSVGTGLGVEPIWQLGKDPNIGNTVTNCWTQLALGAFVDATYAQLAVNYSPTFADIKTTTVTGGSKSEASTGWFISFLDMAVFFKYPFRVGSSLLFPMLGAEYVLCLGGKIEDIQIDAEKKRDLSDLYVLAGLGVDFKLGKRLFLRVLALAG